jgi:hypothetical protein
MNNLLIEKKKGNIFPYHADIINLKAIQNRHYVNSIPITIHL